MNDTSSVISMAFNNKANKHQVCYDDVNILNACLCRDPQIIITLSHSLYSHISTHTWNTLLLSNYNYAFLNTYQVMTYPHIFVKLCYDNYNIVSSFPDAALIALLQYGFAVNEEYREHIITAWFDGQHKIIEIIERHAGLVEMLESKILRCGYNGEYIIDKLIKLKDYKYRFSMETQLALVKILKVYLPLLHDPYHEAITLHKLLWEV